MRSIENAANNEDAKLNCSRLLPPDNRLSLSFNLDDIGNVNQAEYPLAGQYDGGGGGGNNNNGLFNGTSMFQNTSDGGDLTNQPNASSFAQLTKGMFVCVCVCVLVCIHSLAKMLLRAFLYGPAFVFRLVSISMMNTSVSPDMANMPVGSIHVPFRLLYGHVF